MGTWQSQPDGFYRFRMPPDPPSRALDPKTTPVPLQPPEAASRTRVSLAPALPLRAQPDNPRAQGTAGSVARGAALRPTPPPVSDVASSTRAAEVAPPTAPIAAPAISASAMPSALNPAAPVPSAPAPAAIVRSAPPVLAAPSTSVAVNDESAVRTVLNRYRTAYNDLDAGAARDVWPTVDAKALGRAFERLESQELVFDRCQIAVNGNRATAACGGDARFVPKVGKRVPRVESREWTFDVRKTGEQWTISGVEVR